MLSLFNGDIGVSQPMCSLSAGKSNRCLSAPKRRCSGQVSLGLAPVGGDPGSTLQSLSRGCRAADVLSMVLLRRQAQVGHGPSRHMAGWPGASAAASPRRPFISFIAPRGRLLLLSAFNLLHRFVGLHCPDQQMELPNGTYRWCRPPMRLGGAP